MTAATANPAAIPPALRDRAHRALADLDGAPVTAAQLAKLARVTAGAARRVLAEHVAAGRLEPGNPPPGRYAPDHVPHIPAGSWFRVLVTGSRTWTDAHAIQQALGGLRAEHPARLAVVHGACPRGADAIADAWCRRMSVHVEPHPADWTAGRSAGMARNAAMVAAAPALCLAFIRDNSPGATHCAASAERAGIPTTRHRPADPPTASPEETIGMAARATSIKQTLTRQAIAGDRPLPEPSCGVPARPGPLLTAALACAARGWHVFPVIPGDKRPAFPDHTADRCEGRDPRCRDGHVGWEERATTDPARIARAWTAAPYNIGVAAGPSGLLVIDLDTPKPGEETPPEPWRVPGVSDGHDVFALVCELAGQPMPLDTHTVRTGRGGTHLYYRHPPGEQLRNTSGSKGRGLGWLIDTRAHGGYVLAAASVVNGRPYTRLCDGEPAALPLWLADALKPAALPAQRPTAVPLPAGRQSGYLRAAVTAEINRVTNSPPGERNNSLYLAAVALGQLVAGGALAEPDVTAWLADAAAQVGQLPGETGRTIRSGLRAGASRPRQVAA